jgi:hypothetical protein
MRVYAILVMGALCCSATTNIPESDFEDTNVSKKRRVEVTDTVLLPASNQRVFIHRPFSEEEKASFGSRLRSNLEVLERFDLAFGPRFAPLIYNNAGEECPLGNFSLGQPLGASMTSTVFAIELKGRNMTVKYQADCPPQASSEVHALAREAIMLIQLRGSGIVPNFYYLSPPTPMIGNKTVKTGFGLSDENRAECAADAARSIRFMLTERFDTDLYKLVIERGRVNVRWALQTLTSLMNMIEYLHGRGIVHGDIHAGNIGYLADSGKIVLFDFGRAFFTDEYAADLPEIMFEPFSLVHCLYSHWNIEGARFGKRDDVFKAIMIGAFLMNGEQWLDHCVGLETNSSAMMEFKQNSFMFEFVPGGESLGSLLPTGTERETVDQIRFHLAEVLLIARNCSNVDSVPNYRGIIAHLESAVKLL